MIIELVSGRSFKVKNLIYSILSIISLFYTVWFYNFKDGTEKFYNEDGTIQIQTYKNGDVSKIKVFREDETVQQIQTYKDGVLSKVEVFREDGTLEKIDRYERGVYLFFKKMKSIN